MAYTVLASWDFRGSDTASTKRNSRVGSYTLTEGGTPTWSTDGVDCSASSANKLSLTLPTELRVSPVWWVVSLRIMNATAPAELTNVVGFLSTGATGLYSGRLMLCRKPANTSLRWTLLVDGSGTLDSGVTLGTGVDHVIAARRGPTNNPALGIRVNNDAWDGTLNTSNQVNMASSDLLFGSPTADNCRARFHWFVMGSGNITDTEVQDIYDNPNNFIYPPSPTAPIAVISSGYHLHGTNR